MSVTLMSYSESNYDWVQQVGVYAWPYAGQAVNLAKCQITSIKLFLAKENSPTGNAVVSIIACAGTPGTDGLPTGSVLATSDPFDVSTLTGSGQLIEFTFSTPYNHAGGNLAFFLSYNAGSSANKLAMGCDVSSPTDPGNACRYDTEAPGWQAEAGADTCYYILGYWPSTANLFFGNG